MTQSTDSEGGTSSNVVWQEEQVIVRDAQVADYEGSVIPMMFVIPYDVPQTSTDSGVGRRDWKLSVKSLSPAADYRAEFEVPIFRTDDSEPNFNPEPNVIAKFQAASSSGSSLTRAGLHVETLDGKGVRVIFPRGRHLGFAACMAFLQSIFAVAFVAGFYFWWSSTWPYAAGILGSLLFYAIADLVFFQSELEASSNGLAIRTGVFSLGPVQEFDTTLIKRLYPKPAGSAGNVTAFDLYVELTTGKEFLFAKRILSQQTANEVIRLVNGSLVRE